VVIVVEVSRSSHSLLIVPKCCVVFLTEKTTVFSEIFPDVHNAVSSSTGHMHSRYTPLHACIASRVDYCNAVLYGVSTTVAHR